MPRSEERDEEMRQALLPLPASCQSSRAPSPVPWSTGKAVRPHRRAVVGIFIGLLSILAIVGYIRFDRLRWQSYFAPEIAPDYAGPPPVRCPTGDVDLETRLDRALINLEASLRSTPTSGVSWGRTIWTSAKDGVVAARVRDSWTSLNARDGWTYTVLDDDGARQAIVDTFAGPPHALSSDDERLLASALETYDDFDRVVLKTDFLRYALLWRYGGVWTDSDTICMQPIDQWLPESWREDPKTHAILASERDRPYRLEPDWQRAGWTAPDRGYQLVQWSVPTSLSSS